MTILSLMDVNHTKSDDAKKKMNQNKNYGNGELISTVQNKTERKMIIKPIAVIGLLLMMSFASARKLDQVDCRLLQYAINSKDFQRNFYQCDSEQLTIIDTSGVFVNCTITDVCNRTIKFSEKLIYNVNLHTGKEKKSEIVLYNFEKIENKYRIYFWHPYTNRVLALDVKKNRKGFKIAILTEGVF